MFTNNRLVNILIGLSIMALALSGCASSVQTIQPETTLSPQEEPSPAPDTPEAVSHGKEIGGYVELVDALSTAGALVEPLEEVEQAFFSVKGQKIKVTSAEVQVFEYSDEVARKTESDQISQDGTNIGTSMITWVDQPNFWAKGRIIVLYLGKDPAILSLFNSVLGDHLTQQP